MSCVENSALGPHSLLHLMSCRNLLGLPERGPVIRYRLEKESGIPCIDRGGGSGWFGRMAAQSPLTKGTSNECSEASRRTINELGNIELYGLGEISQTVQCTNVPEYTEKKEHFIAQVVYVLCCRQNRQRTETWTQTMAV